MLIEMIRRFASITQVGLSLAASMACGVRDGLAADCLGMQKDAHSEFIEAKERIDRSNSA